MRASEASSPGRRAPGLLELRDLYLIPFWLTARICLSVLSIPTLFALSRIRGAAWSVVSANRTDVVQELERSFAELSGTAQLRRIARRHFQYVKVKEVARLGDLLRGFSRSRVFRVEGLGSLDRALADGNGAILLTGHLGYGKVIKPVLGARGYVVHTVGRAHPARNAWTYSRVGRLVRTGLLRLPPREDEGIADIEAGVNLRPHLAALALNQALIIPADGEDAVSVHRVELLGRPICLAHGVISLARASGAAVLPALAVDADERVGRGIRIEIGTPLPVDSSSDPADALRPFVAVYERCLRTHPHLWCWSEPYFQKDEKRSLGL